MAKKYKVTCAIIINNKGEVLLGKRGRKPHKGKWALFSGIGASMKGLEEEEAVKDEVMHDLGVRFEPNFEFSMPLKNDERADEVLVYSGYITGDVKVNPLAASETCWFALPAMEGLELAFDHKEILRGYFKSNKP